MSSQNLSTFNKNDIGDCSHLKVGIVCSKWNSDITDNLYDGAYSTLIKLGLNKENIISYKVPGSFELVYAANKMSNLLITSTKSKFEPFTWIPYVEALFMYSKT